MNILKDIHKIYSYYPWAIGLILLLALIWYGTKLIHRYLRWRALSQRDLVFLEITPPAHQKRTAEATEHMFNVIHGLGRSSKLKLNPTIMSLEITASYSEGVRFIVVCSKKLARNVTQHILSYLPDSRVTQIQDYLPNDAQNSKVISFKQEGHWAFPFRRHESLDEYDPVANITSTMAQLKPGELMTIQYVIRPDKIREAKVYAGKILGNEALLDHLQGKRKSDGLEKVFGVVRFFTGGILNLGNELFNSSYSYGGSSNQRLAYERLQVAYKMKPARTITNSESEIMEDIHHKVSSRLFRAEMRAMIVSVDQDDVDSRVNGLQSALTSYSSAYQQIEIKKPRFLLRSMQDKMFVNRQPSLHPKSSMILSNAELASLFHFPIGDVSHTENLVTSLSPTLPAPITLKQGTSFDVAIGENEHHGIKTNIGLSSEERQRHLYIVGGTGSGKTTMLQYMAVQDMKSGNGVAVVDPHGDLATTLLKHVPEDRINDVIYFDPDDLDHPIGLNLLELSPGLSGNDFLRDRDRVTSTVVSVFRKIFSEDDSGGHRVEYVLRNTVLTALTVPGATLFTVLKLLQNSTFRKKVVAKLKDKDLKDFWRNEMGKAGNMQRVKMSAGVTNKIGRFNSNAAANFVLSQKKSTINFEDIIDSGKILICNFSKSLGEDVSELFGITVLAKLQLAVLRRAKVSEDDRKPYYLYVDEFQNFATPSFVQMLSESRKYKLYMTMAEQSTSQQKDLHTVQVLLANVGTFVCFKTANIADEQYFLPLFRPYIDEGKLASLSAYNFYAKLSAVKSQEPVSGITLLLEYKGDKAIADQVIKASRKQYCGRSKPTRSSPNIKRPSKHKSTDKKEDTPENTL